MADTRCDWVRQELAEVCRGRAPADIASRVQSHLSECADCRAEADWDGRLGESLADAPAAGRQLESLVRQLVRRRRWLRGAAGGVAAAALVGVISLALIETQGWLRRPVATDMTPKPADAVVMKELAGVVNTSPVARLQADRQHELLMAELELLAQGDKQ
jgi:hypothetical protein